jgi:hypothetical protein
MYLTIEFSPTESLKIPPPDKNKNELSYIGMMVIYNV